IEGEITEVKNHLKNIIPYTVNYFRQIKKKYGKGRERKTEIRNFDSIEAAKVVAINAKLYANYHEGFIGTGLKKDEFVCDCSDIDDILTIRRNGSYMITKVAEKVFVGPDIIYAGVFLRNDERTMYNIVYQDGKDGPLLAKRSAITGLTREKEYNLTRGKPGTRIMYLSVNPNGEAEVIKVFHKPRPRLKKAMIEFDFSTLAIKGKTSMGNIVTKLPVQKVVLKEKGISTLGGLKIWFDDSVLRLNADGRGRLLGEFSGDDKILVVTKDGKFRTSNFDLANHYEDNILLLEKFRPEIVCSAIYWDAEQKFYYVKRFMLEESERPLSFIGDHPDSKLVSLTEVEYPRFEISFGGKHKNRKNEIVEVDKFIGVKSYKAKGKRLTNYVVENIQEIEPVIKKEVTLPESQPEPEDDRTKSAGKDQTNDPAQMKLEL
ncbi:MAG: DNA gyrase/topoisomerase IV subunit A, partial [Bacteroidales bacterium]|nr:DNA gyrase/topoisomerase IV subunit A [Bacteroidales bacterium]